MAASCALWCVEVRTNLTALCSKYYDRSSLMPVKWTMQTSLINLTHGSTLHNLVLMLDLIGEYGVQLFSIVEEAFANKQFARIDHHLSK